MGREGWKAVLGQREGQGLQWGEVGGGKGRGKWSGRKGGGGKSVGLQARRVHVMDLTGSS